MNNQKPAGTNILVAQSPDLISAKPMKTTYELSKQLNVAERTLEKWRFTGKGPAFVRLSSKTVRYREEDIQEWIASNSYKNTAQISS